MGKPGKRFWTALVLFGLIGQVAWVVENMYLNVFIYKMFHASAAGISLMVSASAVAATLTTILMGALTDRVGKRKIFICGGYLMWGFTIFAFGLVRMDLLTPLCGGTVQAAALGVNLVIVLDCVMTFFGSAANDAAYNAWLTDAGDDTNRGKIEGINAMMPLVAILVVFGGFMGFSLTEASSWTIIFSIIGAVVLIVGALGIFLIDEVPSGRVAEEKAKASDSYLENLLYSFRPRIMRENKLLYAVLGAFALFGISIQIFMPYLIVYYEQTLQMSNYVIVLAPAIILAAAVTMVYGRLYDRLGFQKSILPVIGMLVGGYVILYFAVNTLPVFLGSLLMMSGYLSGMAVFGAVIRERTPEHMAGRFQGMRIIAQVLVPGVIGPAIGAFVLRDAAQIENQDGTFSFLPDKGIWAAATLAALVLLLAVYGIFAMIRKGHYDLWTEAGERRRDGKQEQAKEDSKEDRENKEDKESNESKGSREKLEETGQDSWAVHPAPQMRRAHYVVLQDGWTLNDRPIRIPFPPQSLLAQYGRRVGSKLIYETTFRIPEDFTKERILLHFGAVDQKAEILIDGQPAGSHEGGYLPFTLDITRFADRKKKHRLTVKAQDSLSKAYPYGKQCKKRGGMWYTPVSGIWQSVWLENVPEVYLKKIVWKPDLSGVNVHLEVEGAPADRLRFEARIRLSNGEISTQHFKGLSGRIELTEHICENGKHYEPRLWNTEDPWLYETVIRLDGDSEPDEVETYFALRTIRIKEIDGISRVCLNGQPVFLHGVLDQGYFSDGIYLPAEPAEYERDVLRMKELGFNLLRKHIKIEPEWFYYYCDKHGMLVMQDMVNSGRYSFLRDTALPTIGTKKRKDTTGITGKRKAFFIKHAEDTIAHLYNHPCIVAYTIFNEGWGQFESDALYDMVHRLDDSRLIDSASGWFAQEKSDFDSEHIYFRAECPQVRKRPLFVSECGGYSRVIEGHYYSKYNTYGYGSEDTQQALTQRIEQMYRCMILPGIPKGVCGCVYTQLSDVEDEVNGLYTYDRKICKVDKTVMQQLSTELQAENSMNSLT